MEINWTQAKQIFREAIDLPPGSRTAFVQSNCADAGTAEHVLQLLASHNESDEFLASPIAPDWSMPDALIDTQVGQFRIEKRIGTGGMGAVYQAKQDNPERHVAVKVLRNDILVDNSVLRRFQNEAQILGQLKHPNIAHVYESGSLDSDQGRRPWFAMELIEGCTLKEFAESHSLTNEEKLQLVLLVCDAVAHAHEKGIVHRDLKPGNIIIGPTQSDREMPSLKVVDFGIARVIESSVPVHSMTRTVLGTLDYLSPEQVNEQLSTPDYRSDIFALGVVTHELLTGELPFDRRTGSITNILSRIGTETKKVRSDHQSNLPRDLELVVRQAIEFDPGQRYQTINGFAEDIRRYLRQEPVSARAPSTWYRFRKYAQRNRILVGGATTTILALLAGIITYASIAKEARQAESAAKYEAEKAVAVNSYITNDFLTKLLTRIKSKEPVDVVNLVDESASNIETIFADQPLVEAAVRNEVGTIYYNLGLFDRASEQYENALTLWKNGLSENHADTLKAVSNLAQTQLALGPAATHDVESLLRHAYDGRRKQLGPEDPATLRSLNNLAEYLRRHEKMDEAEQLYLAGLSIIESQTVQDDKTAITLMSNLGALYVKQEQMDKAVALQRNAHDRARSVFGSTHTITIQSGLRYASTLDRIEQYEKALKILDPLLTELKKVVDTDPAGIFSPMRLQAKIFRHQGNLDRAREILQEALMRAETRPKQFEYWIKRLERDLRRLDR